MIFYRELKLKDNRTLILRNAEAFDARDYISYFVAAHAETNYLTSYPDESRRDARALAGSLQETKLSTSEAEICAFVDGKLVGSAGIGMVKDRDKTRHRAEYGISVLKEYWGLGIGSALTQGCIDLAREAGYLQLELDVVSDNQSAITLYEKFGFVEYGRNPRAFRTREGQWQELVLMRLEL